MTGTSATRRAIEAVWRIESPRLIAALARMLRDVGAAEEAAQDAFVDALRQWPGEGIPQNPGAWLMAAARRGAIDGIRRDRRLREIQEGLGHAAGSHDGEGASRAVEARLDGAVEDDLLRLMFMACHPALSGEARAALTLRLLCGLTTAEIARAFLVPEATIAQRIVRAKRTLGEHRESFEAPAGAELAERLGSVLEVVYLLFNEGYAATAGEDWMRPALCEEALRLGRILAELAPGEAEVHGLAALMEIQASRRHARVDASGKPILLLDQNRALWDQVLIRRGLAALARAEAGEAGPYTLQARIAACHARARTPEATDWREIVGHYDRLAALAPSPVVELNRAVAVSMASGPQAGLDLVDRLADEPELAGYHLLPAVRGDLLFKVGRRAEAGREFERAAALCGNARERGVLLERARACGG